MFNTEHALQYFLNLIGIGKIVKWYYFHGHWGNPIWKKKIVHIFLYLHEFEIICWINVINVEHFHWAFNSLKVHWNWDSILFANICLSMNKSVILTFRLQTFKLFVRLLFIVGYFSLFFITFRSFKWIQIW